MILYLLIKYYLLINFKLLSYYDLMESYRTTSIVSSPSGTSQLYYGISPTECTDYIKQDHNKRLRRELLENNNELRYFNRESEIKIKILFLVISLVVGICLVTFYISNIYI